MNTVHVAKTASRSVLGIMVDFAFAVPFHLVDADDRTMVTTAARPPY